MFGYDMNNFLPLFCYGMATATIGFATGARVAHLLGW